MTISWLTVLLACGSPPPTPEAPPVPASEEVAAAAPAPVAPRVEAPDLAVVNDAFVLADRLRQADQKILDPAVSDEDAGRWGHAQQRVLRSLAEDGVLASKVLASIKDETVRARAADLLVATREIAFTAKPRTDLPDWRIEAPKPAGVLRGFYGEAEAAHGVPWSILAAIHLHETRMGRLRGVSPAGAQGPMQFMPPTWKAYGAGDVNDNRDAILAAGNYVAKSGWKKDPAKAIWAYNHSEHYVTAVQKIAEVLDREPGMYRGLWGWQVYYRTVQGPIWLDEGYASPTRRTIDSYCSTTDEVHCPKVH